ncbi:MAG: acyltransferase [Planctomycetota bacterium]|jgi:acetyltransferase-like isoleucine patch superfamily enzyme
MTGISGVHPEVSIGLLIANGIFQKVLHVNHGCPYLVHYTSTVRCPKAIHLSQTAHKSLAINGGCYLQGRNGIVMEEGVIFAAGCKIISSNHDLKDISGHLPSSPIRIRKDCWIGANAVVLPGVEIGPNSVVGAGAVVTKDVPANVIVAGVPASVVREKPQNEFRISAPPEVKLATCC